MDSFELSEDSKRVFRDIMKSKDVDGNGLIDRREFKECLKSVGFIGTNSDIDFLMEQFDANNDGKLRIDDVVSNLDVVNAHSLKKSELVAAFNLFDIQKDGCIRPYELKMILTKPGPDQMSPQEADDIIKHLLHEYDANHDGKFSYPEFVRILLEEKIASDVFK